MKAISGTLYSSATDLSGFLACPHLTALTRAHSLSRIPGPPEYEDPRLDVLKQRGEEHERQYLAAYEQDGRRVVTIEQLSYDIEYRERWSRMAAATLDAMRDGADVVYQAAFFDGTWVGKADFLVRVEKPSGLGAYSYEVLDTKLAREAKGGALLQILLYSQLVAKIQDRMPDEAHLALAGPDARLESFRIADYAAYFRSVRDRFLAHVEHSGARPLASAVDPVAQCDLCDWRKRCD